MQQRVTVPEGLRGGLIVSCQAPEGHPFAAPEMIAALTRCAELGGAVGVRVEGAANVAAASTAVGVPVMGIAKVPRPAGRPFITPNFQHCRDLVTAGAALVAIEATLDLRADPAEFPALCARVHDELGVPVLADVSTLEEGRAAARAGADLVASTLSGYTTTSEPRTTPDLDLIAGLAADGIATVLEGHVRRPEEIAAAFEHGAWAAVVGTAITDPAAITTWFTAAAPRSDRPREAAPTRTS